MKTLMFCMVLVFSLMASMIINFNAKAGTGDEKVFAGWILHMFISGQLKEYTPRGGMAECLKVKRKIMRSQGTGHGTRWECKKGKLKLRHYDAGKDGMKWLPVEHLGKE